MKRYAPQILSALLVVSGFILLYENISYKPLSLLYGVLRGGALNVEIIHRLAYNCIWYGFLALVLSFCFRIENRSWEGNGRYVNVIFITATVIILGMYSWYAFNLKSAIINGLRYWWLIDDEMISMRYARNLVNGLGLVWNPGERVEGFTNFLWTMYMSLVHLLPVSAAKASLPMLITSILLVICTTYLVVRITRLLGGNTLEILLIALAFVMNLDVIFCTLDGFESIPIMFLTLLVIYLVLKAKDKHKIPIGVFIAISAISLLRADGLVISLMLYGLVIIAHPDRKGNVLKSLIFLVIPEIYLIFRLGYYGELLPNTAYLKVMNWNGRLDVGLKYLVKFVSHYLLLIALMFIYAIKTRRMEALYLCLCFVVYCGYIAWVGGDNFLNNRFFMPFITIIIIFGILGLRLIGLRAKWLPLAYMLMFLTLPLQTPYTISRPLEPEKCNIGNIEIGLYLKENTPQECTVADFWAGSVFYFSDRKGVDLLGKMDPYIAKLDANKTSRLPGHNKYDFDYSLGILKPDVLVASFNREQARDGDKLPVEGNEGFKGLLYRNAVFRDYYRGNPINLNTWRQLYIRKDSRLHECEEIR